MKLVLFAAVLVMLHGCSSTDFLAYREEPRAFGNPALLNCAAGRAPVCSVEGGRASKRYSNCSCRAVGGGAY